MKIENIEIGDKIKIKNIDLIRCGELLWENDDKVEIRNKSKEFEYIDVWDKDKKNSELIYEDEFKGIEKA